MTAYTVDLADDQADAVEQAWPADAPPAARDVYAQALYALAQSIRATRAAAASPRMPEPLWGEKVIAHTGDTPDRREFLHIYGPQGGDAYQSPLGGNYSWAQLIDPQPVGGIS